MHFCGLSSCVWRHMVIIIEITIISFTTCLLIPFAVENGRQKTPRSLCIQTQTSPDALSSEKTLELAQYKTKCENQSRFILRLKQLVSCGNTKFEALTVVIQHLLSEVRPCTPQAVLSLRWGSSVHGLFRNIFMLMIAKIRCNSSSYAFATHLIPESLSRNLGWKHF